MCSCSQENKVLEFIVPVQGETSLGFRRSQLRIASYITQDVAQGKNYENPLSTAPVHVTVWLKQLKRVINAMGVMLYSTNALCMAVLAISADKWEGTSTAKDVDTAVMVVQLLTLLGEWGVSSSSEYSSR